MTKSMIVEKKIIEKINRLLSDPTRKDKKELKKFNQTKIKM